jgi:hypothetical protein
MSSRALAADCYSDLCHHIESESLQEFHAAKRKMKRKLGASHDQKSEGILHTEKYHD